MIRGYIVSHIVFDFTCSAIKTMYCKMIPCSALVASDPSRHAPASVRRVTWLTASTTRLECNSRFMYGLLSLRARDMYRSSGWSFGSAPERCGCQGSFINLPRCHRCVRILSSAKIQTRAFRVRRSCTFNRCIYSWVLARFEFQSAHAERQLA